jgi:hypothetical protein
MSNRIPVSLNWLVKKRAEVHGELIRLKKERTEFVGWCDNRIYKLEADMKALDRTLRLHEIKISPDKIPYKQAQPVSKKLKYGQLTSLILDCIKESKEGAVNTKEIMYFIAAHTSDNFEQTVSSREFYQSVKNRLKNLCAQGVLERVPTNSLGQVRYFRLKLE